MSNSTGKAELITIPLKLRDKSVSKILDGLELMLTAKCSVIVVDCANIDTLSSSHIGLFSRIRRRCDEMSVKIEFTNPSSELLMTLYMLGFISESENKETIDEYQDTKKIVIPSSHISHYDDLILLSLEEIESAVNRFITYLVPLGISKIQLYVLKTLLFETTTNICLHSELPEDSSISFQATVEENQITLIFTDKGVKFDPTNYRQNSNAMTSARFGVWQGYGISMIKKLSDSVRYERNDNNENILIITKRWR